MARIDHWHTQMPGIGTRKLVRQLKNEGFSVDRKLVRRLKTEEIYLNVYPTPRALRKAISVYIQQYNTVRPHQALEYKTPESIYQSCFASQATDLDSLVLAG